MLPVAPLSHKPARLTAEEHFARWFADLAARLLNQTDFFVAGLPYRFAELEVYYHGPGHADPFTHRHPLQRMHGRWYFHRTGGGYRGGSFKGLDLTWGDGTAYFGLLIRSIVDPGGEVIVGPSRTVDRLLAVTGAKNVATLDQMIGGRSVWDASAPVAIRVTASPRSATVYRSSRVGLSVQAAVPEAFRFVGQPYRFLTQPRAITRGRPQLVLNLHQAGWSPAAIHDLTGVPRRTIERYIGHFEAGRTMRGLDRSIGKQRSIAEVCMLLGTWAACFGRAAANSPVT
jgi:hypothetical protein